MSGSGRGNWVHVSIGYPTKAEALLAKSRIAKHELRPLKVVKAGGYWVVQARQFKSARNPIPDKEIRAMVRRLPSGQVQIKIPLKRNSSSLVGAPKRFSVQVTKGRAEHYHSEHSTLSSAKRRAVALRRHFPDAEILVFDSRSNRIPFVVRPRAGRR